MKRLVIAAVPLLATAMLLVAPVAAKTKNHLSCTQVRSELAAGKKPAQIAADLKVSQTAVARCSAKVASSKQHTRAAQPQDAPAR